MGGSAPLFEFFDREQKFCVTYGLSFTIQNTVHRGGSRLQDQCTRMVPYILHPTGTVHCTVPYSTQYCTQSDDSRADRAVESKNFGFTVFSVFSFTTLNFDLSFNTVSRQALLYLVYRDMK